MNEMTKHGQVGLAAVRAGMDRKTARKYVWEGKLPSDLVEPRAWLCWLVAHIDADAKPADLSSPK